MKRIVFFIAFLIAYQTLIPSGGAIPLWKRAKHIWPVEAPTYQNCMLSNYQYNISGTLCEYRISPAHWHAGVDIPRSPNTNVYSVDNGSASTVYEVESATVSAYVQGAVEDDPRDGIGDGWWSHRYKHVSAAFHADPEMNIRVGDQLIWNTAHTTRYQGGDGKWFYPLNQPIAVVQDMASPHVHLEEISYDDLSYNEVPDGYWYFNPLCCLNPFADNILPIIDSLLLYPEGSSSPITRGTGSSSDPYIVDQNLDVRIKARDITPGGKNVNIYKLTNYVYREDGSSAGSSYANSYEFDLLETTTDEGTYICSQGVNWIYDSQLSTEKLYYYWPTNHYTYSEGGHNGYLNVSGLQRGKKYRIETTVWAIQYVPDSAYCNTYAKSVWFKLEEGPKTSIECSSPVSYGNGVVINWETIYELDTGHFLVEKECDEAQGGYRIISSEIPPNGNREKGCRYSFTDPEGTLNDSYRIVEVDNSGRRGIYRCPLVKTGALDWGKASSPKGQGIQCENGGDYRGPITVSSITRMASTDSLESAIEWIAIYPDSFTQAMLPLVLWRDSLACTRNRRGAGKTIEEISSAYGNIKAYLTHLGTIDGSSLKYVFLVGDASSCAYYETCPGTIHNIIPTDRFEDGYEGLPYYSDVEYGDMDTDGYAEIAVGRLPAGNKLEVALYVSKLLYYEGQGPGAWKNEVSMLVFDRNVGYCTGEYARQIATDLRDAIPGQVNLHYITAADTTTVNFPDNYDQMESVAIDEFDSGRALVLSLGSAAYLDNLAQWLNTAWILDDPFRISELSPNYIFPFVIGASCDIGNFTKDWEDESHPSIIEELLFSSDRGAIACYAPTGATWQAGNYEVCRELLKYLYEIGSPSLGHACMAAQKRVLEEEKYYSSTARMYMLFGDPAIKLAGALGSESEGKPFCEAEFSYKDPWRVSLFTCPCGLADTLLVHLDFEFDHTPRNIGAEELTIHSVPEDSSFTLFSSGEITADSAATLTNYFLTSITHSAIGGCGIEKALSIDCGSDSVASILLSVKSSDYNGDGESNLSDYALLGSTYLKVVGEPGFNSCFDFNDDQVVNLQDVVYFGNHYHHSYSGILGNALSGQREVATNIELEYVIRDKRAENGIAKYCIALYMKNANSAATFCIGLRNDGMNYDSIVWKKSEAIGSEVLVVPIENMGRRMLFLSGFGNSSLKGSRLELGTLEVNARTGGNGRIEVGEFNLVFGDIMLENGGIGRLNGVKSDNLDDVGRGANWDVGNYPNPFNPKTMIEYSLAKGTDVNISIYNVAGQLVRVLVSGKQKADRYNVIWDGRDDSGRSVSSGVYFCRFKTKEAERAKKLILLR